MLERLRYARTYRGYLQREMADKIGLTRTHYNQLELGNDPLTDRTIKAVCTALNIREEWLRTGEGEMDAQPVDELGVILDNYAIDRETEFGKTMFRVLQAYHDAPEEIRDAVDEFVRILGQTKRED